MIIHICLRGKQTHNNNCAQFNVQYIPELGSTVSFRKPDSPTDLEERTGIRFDHPYKVADIHTEFDLEAPNGISRLEIIIEDALWTEMNRKKKSAEKPERPSSMIIKEGETGPGF